MASCLRGTPIAGEAEGDKDAQGTAGRAPFGGAGDHLTGSTGLRVVRPGVLATGATAWAIFSRTGRSPSSSQEPDGQEPDGQDEPDVVLDVPELEVDRITLEVR